jgi:hypothetical protein
VEETGMAKPAEIKNDSHRVRGPEGRAKLVNPPFVAGAGRPAG